MNVAKGAWLSLDPRTVLENVPAGGGILQDLSSMSEARRERS